MYDFPVSIISAVEGEWSASCPGSFTTCNIRLMGTEWAPKIGLHVLQEIKIPLPLPGMNYGPTSPYSRHYTDIKERK